MSGRSCQLCGRPVARLASTRAEDDTIDEGRTAEDGRAVTQGVHVMRRWVATRCGRDLGRVFLRRVAVTAAIAVAGGLASAGTTVAQMPAEMAPVAAAYGSGVHAYFAGDYDRSFAVLTDAIAAGIKDPRAWYFRGLAALRLGRLDEAEADFTEGAERESSGTGAWSVSRSLERVQGADRLRLERHRVRARVAALQRDRDALRRRISELDEAQPDVRRSRRPASGVRDDGDPFAGGGAAESIPAPAAGDETTATPPAPAEDDAPIKLEVDDPLAK